MSSAVLALESVSKSFDGNSVLSGIDLEIRRGETLSILGGSGIGKSVTLKLLIGLLRVDSGKVFFRDRDVTALDERGWTEVRRRFGMVFQGSALFDSLSVLENVAYPLREHTDRTDAEIRGVVAEKRALVGLVGIEELQPAELSGGMRKRVGVARAVAMDPEVILYDEPTTGLDPANARRIAELIRSLQRELGVTSVVVTHDLPLCFSVSDRIGLLHDGTLAQLDTPAGLRSHQGEAMREFLGGAALPPV